MKRYLIVLGLVSSILAACASPTSDAMMAKASPSVDAMVNKTTPTADTMMSKTTPTADVMMKKETPVAEAMMSKTPAQMFAAHFVDSAPMHGQAFVLVPDQVLINFNFTLDETSSIIVTKDNQPVTIGKVMLGERKLSLSATLPKDAGDGLYVVKYKACWPDKSCHDGLFAFTVDSKLKSSYEDMTGKSQVTIRLKDIKFAPATLIVSNGTQVTWVNDDAVTHFINTDPHPTHNALPALNSLEIQTGESYRFTFTQPGEWAYHCSAHVPQNMVGRVIVLDDQKLTAMPTTQAMREKQSPTVAVNAMRKKESLDKLPVNLIAAHFVLSNPDHADILDQVPEKIHIAFNFNLHAASNIAVTKDGKPVAIKPTIGQFSIDATLPADVGDGLYVVKYKACWPDRSCHEGQFAFKVDSKMGM